ncbi:proteasome subunit beta type-4 [Diprion similis]|uniref:proteasome subunit beta type-4 n=1 Tax=Diprion similis TaxID=362088 RepID=UPI001EF98826|nr:proteasome subunit beta type-4 [Diprion similis]
MIAQNTLKSQVSHNMAFLGEANLYSSFSGVQNTPFHSALHDLSSNTSVPDIYGSQRSQAPLTTATSVVGLQFKDGVVIAADVLGSYGSLARFRNCQRIMKVNDNIILGAGGDYADFQYLKNIIEQKILEEECLDDGFSLKPKSLHCWLTRVMYNRRSKFDPFWNNFIIAGLEYGQPFMGTVDKLGTAYIDPVIATGYGAYMATPLLRKALESKPDLNKEEAIEILTKAMQVLFYRDARSFPKYQIGIISTEGIEIRGPLTLESNWELAHMIG